MEVPQIVRVLAKVTRAKGVGKYCSTRLTKNVYTNNRSYEPKIKIIFV